MIIRQSAILLGCVLMAAFSRLRLIPCNLLERSENPACGAAGSLIMLIMQVCASLRLREVSVRCCQLLPYLAAMAVRECCTCRITFEIIRMARIIAQINCTEWGTISDGCPITALASISREV